MEIELPDNFVSEIMTGVSGFLSDFSSVIVLILGFLLALFFIESIIELIRGKETETE